MRVVGLTVLVGAVLITAVSVARFGEPAPNADNVPPAHRDSLAGKQTGDDEDTPRAITPQPAPPALTALPADTPPARAKRRERHEFLADRAAAGDAAAALELLALLEDCAERDETRGMMQIIEQDWGPAPACSSSDECAATEHEVYELQDSLSRSRAVEQDCRPVPRKWIALRGHWLERAAELGDPEARACYALTGVELAPQAFDRSFASWMEDWRRQALPWAWDAWRRGEPRAALALARIYAPSSNFGGDVGLTEPDAVLAHRFALLLTRALELDPESSELARSMAQSASLLSAEQQGDDDVWVESQLPGIEQRLGRLSRTPNQCWQNFAAFEPLQAPSAFTAAR